MCLHHISIKRVSIYELTPSEPAGGTIQYSSHITIAYTRAVWCDSVCCGARVCGWMELSWQGGGGRKSFGWKIALPVCVTGVGSDPKLLRAPVWAAYTTPAQNIIGQLSINQIMNSSTDLNHLMSIALRIKRFRTRKMDCNRGRTGSCSGRHLDAACGKFAIL